MLILFCFDSNDSTQHSTKVESIQGCSKVTVLDLATLIQEQSRKVYQNSRLSYYNSTVSSLAKIYIMDNVIEHVLITVDQIYGIIICVI